MDAREFFPIAERLMNSANEAERRTSAGRSYYGLFHVLLAALSARGVIFRQTPDDHQTLISYLTKAGNKEAALVGSALKDLRQDRNRADYQLADVFSARTSEFAYQKAKRALGQFESVPPDEVATIIRNIQAFARTQHGAEMGVK